MVSTTHPVKPVLEDFVKSENQDDVSSIISAWTLRQQMHNKNCYVLQLVGVKFLKIVFIRQGGLNEMITFGTSWGV